MAESPSDSDPALTHKGSSASGVKHLLWIEVAVKLDELCYRPRPARLMAGPNPGPVISVEVLEEKQVISPVRVSTRKPGSGRSGGGKLRGASTRAGSLRNRHPLQQVLLNLILNGMEAMSESSKSNRRLTVRTAYDGKGNVEVAVEDSGPGIPPDRLPRLFDSFFTTKLHGMGLGLSIVRSIVEAHGGRIWAENNSSGGACFRFTLPVNGKAAKRYRRSVLALLLPERAKRGRFAYAALPAADFERNDITNS